MCEKVVGELLPVQHEAGPHARQIYPSRPSAVGSELNSSVDFEPRYPLPHPLDKIDKILFNRICRQREAGRGAFSEMALSVLNQAESASSSHRSETTTSSTASGVTGSFNPLDPQFTYSPDIKVRCIFDKTGEGVVQRMHKVHVWVKRRRDSPMQFMFRLNSKNCNGVCPPIKVCPMFDFAHSPK